MCTRSLTEKERGFLILFRTVFLDFSKLSWGVCFASVALASMLLYASLVLVYLCERVEVDSICV